MSDQGKTASEGQARPSSGSAWAVRLIAVLVIVGTVAYFWNSGTEPKPELPAPIPNIPVGNVPKRVVAAVQSSRKAIEKSPQSGDAWGELGMVLYAHSFSREAIEALEVAERLAPTDPRWPYVRGMIVSENNRSDGIEYLKRAHELASEDANVQMRLAEFHFDLGEFDASETNFREVLSQLPNSARAAVGMARLAIAQRDKDAALKWARQAASQQPKLREPHQLLAQIYRQLNKPDDVKREMAILATMPTKATAWPDPILEAIGSMRQDPSGISDRAHQLIASGQVDEGLQMLQQVVEDDPKNPRRFSLLANQLIKARKYDQARSVLSAGLARHPEFVDLHYYRGVVQADASDYQTALSTLGKVVERKPDFAEAHYIMGTCYRRLDKMHDAAASFRNVLRFEPTFAPAHIGLAEVLLSQKQRDKAVKHLQQALKFDPHNEQAAQLLRDAKAEE